MLESRCRPSVQAIHRPAAHTLGDVHYRRDACSWIVVQSRSTASGSGALRRGLENTTCPGGLPQRMDTHHGLGGMGRRQFVVATLDRYNTPPVPEPSWAKRPTHLPGGLGVLT